MLNQYSCIGRLTRNPEPRVTQGGAKVTHFSLAVNESYTNKAGEKCEKTVFTEWLVWNGSGENLCKIASKGDLIFAQGKFSLEEWRDKEGNKRSQPKFTAFTWQLLNKAGATKKTVNGESEDKIESAPKSPTQQDTQKPVVEDNNEDGNDEDDDIPF